ncbi:MAG: hypothetical protein LBQ93_09055 [Treponema sp.]|jgi:hypothetical protein|nr:hypothetical protein [Treponema sp.]
MKRKARCPLAGILIFFVFGITISGCASNPQSLPRIYSNLALTGETEELLSGTKWALYYSAGYPHEIVQFENDGRAVWFRFLSGETNNDNSKNSSWERNGNTVKIVYFNGAFLIEGILNETNTRITFKNHDGELFLEPYSAL